MSDTAKKQIQALIDRETLGLNSKDADLFVDFHSILDIDSLWRDKDTKQEIQWKGRVCKFYTRMTSGDWKYFPDRST